MARLLCDMYDTSGRCAGKSVLDLVASAACPAADGVAPAPFGECPINENATHPPTATAAAVARTASVLPLPPPRVGESEVLSGALSKSGSCMSASPIVM